MLPQENRIRQSRDFSKVYRHGQKVVSKHLVLRALAHPQAEPSGGEHSLLGHPPLPPARIGITVSQKVSKRAVVRNRLKRQVRAALRGLAAAARTGLVDCDQPAPRGGSVRICRNFARIRRAVDQTRGYPWAFVRMCSMRAAPHVGDLVINLLLAFTIICIPLTVGAITRALWLRYRNHQPPYLRNWGLDGARSHRHRLFRNS